ncbi:sugar ABC transporter ATP-binding protein [Microlunatus soli]|uniref:Monosaccharide ABC transporter ATP-binding protein, CUT2 family n=1 Tax=Microlunatus soli TaxID=630515 RepID=A0A1H1Q0J8_9ACTN|nr:sugar ABC transporter ATP-binding protein [Microlunatus soli]SDS16955.1 monosaccharide ABC transporter ATP-binding protein, CUT2 family [Microlunatus soli]
MSIDQPPLVSRGADPGEQRSDPPGLRAERISKAYLGIPALEDVDLEAGRGTIHALAGQNGAGKSTLVKILSGAETPDSGSIAVNGRTVSPGSPLDAQRAGIQTIYQELSLVPSLSVAENILIDGLPRRRVGIDWRETRRRAVDALDRVGLDLDVRAPVGTLSVAEQQGVELAKALHRKADVVLLDEPTSALPPPDVDRLFSLLRRLAADGVTMIYISHRMDELLGLCDDVTVLRDGRRVRSFPIAGSRPEQIVAAMVGGADSGGDEAAVGPADRQRSSSAAASTATRSSTTPDRPLLAAAAGGRPARLSTGATDRVIMTADGLSEGLKFDDVSVELRAGEVLGIVGLVGSGQSEVAGCLAGARRRDAGSVRIDGRPTKLLTPRHAIAEGIGFLPQDRKSQGFIPELSVAANITLASLPMFSRAGARDDRRERRVAAQFADRLGMRISGVGQPMKTLSGGTQQKAILARWMVRSSRILICDEPTRGVDVAAKEDIYELLREFAKDGGAIVLATSEVSEALMCDRVLVMVRGHVVADLSGDEIDPDGRAIIQHFG